MSTYYDVISGLIPNRLNRTAMLLEGPGSGGKIIWSDHEILFDSDPDGFLRAHEAEIAGSPTGVLETAGRRIYTEVIGNVKKIVICGAGHVSLPIIRLSKMIGCHVTVLEDRPDFAGRAEKAGADTVILDDYSHALRDIPGDPDTFFVIVTRGHQWDTECLRAVIRKESAYIGMMGSARRVGIVKEQLISEGFDAGKVQSVHSPIGLKIGAETPEEIAISILAEIIQVKNERKDMIYPRDILQALCGGPHASPLIGRKIMAVIIDKHGSAPREPGTRMILTEDGTQVGTVGGGYAEGCILKAAREMLAQEMITSRILHITLMADQTVEEGEICGGTLDVWLEEV